jgi:hypothetical protein
LSDKTIPKLFTVVFLLTIFFSIKPYNLQAQENSKTGPITQKLMALDARFQTLEENQKLILANQDKILKTLDQLKIWARRN